LGIIDVEILSNPKNSNGILGPEKARLFLACKLNEGNLEFPGEKQKWQK
jgi:hypothetical protein